MRLSNLPQFQCHFMSLDCSASTFVWALHVHDHEQFSWPTGVWVPVVIKPTLSANQISNFCSVNRLRHETNIGTALEQ